MGGRGKAGLQSGVPRVRRLPPSEALPGHAALRSLCPGHPEIEARKLFPACSRPVPWDQRPSLLQSPMDLLSSVELRRPDLVSRPRGILDLSYVAVLAAAELPRSFPGIRRSDTPRSTPMSPRQSRHLRPGLDRAEDRFLATVHPLGVPSRRPCRRRRGPSPRARPAPGWTDHRGRDEGPSQGAPSSPVPRKAAGRDVRRRGRHPGNATLQLPRLGRDHDLEHDEPESDLQRLGLDLPGRPVLQFHPPPGPVPVVLRGVQRHEQRARSSA